MANFVEHLEDRLGKYGLDETSDNTLKRLQTKKLRRDMRLGQGAVPDKLQAKDGGDDGDELVDKFADALTDRLKDA